MVKIKKHPADDWGVKSDPPVKNTPPDVVFSPKRGAKFFLAPGICMEDLGRKIGVDPGQIARILNKEWRPKDLGIYDAICVVLGWTRPELDAFMYKRYRIAYEQQNKTRIREKELVFLKWKKYRAEQAQLRQAEGDSSGTPDGGSVPEAGG